MAQDALHAAGGVESYLASVIPALRDRGHSVALLYVNRRDSAPPIPGVDGPILGVGSRPVAEVFDQLRAWRPDLCMSHNMSALDVERRALAEWPVVKFMHGYFGTCVSALKTHAFPGRVACSRILGPACLALYVPRHCGPLNPAAMAGGYLWANAQHALLGRYAAVVVGSAHMQEEFARHGVSRDRLAMIPLFPTTAPAPARSSDGVERTSLLFLGRMTDLKGGDLLIKATRIAGESLPRPVPLVMAGDGPQRAEWERLASREGVAAEFPGWLDAAGRNAALARAAVLAVPSVWPEPFGLVGLEAAAVGVPSIAFDVGGISQWLWHRRNGLLVTPSGGAAAFAAAIREMFGDAALRARLGAGAIETAGELSLDAHVARLEQVLEQAAGR